ncbi:hypothetical protein B0H66DRAFT_101483 [Apodospora peruviana]|uniref:Uncharacterized protein n=1 Tax=Apodospora peruviana TaxID=516989 RepID=A0AAE0HSG3_9PEZI|nr:hypothetical protein B0H66DRAFT_101483 [Apodospora peruviana]
MSTTRNCGCPYRLSTQVLGRSMEEKNNDWERSSAVTMAGQDIFNVLKVAVKLGQFVLFEEGAKRHAGVLPLRFFDWLREWVGENNIDEQFKVVQTGSSSAVLAYPYLDHQVRAVEHFANLFGPGGFPNELATSTIRDWAREVLRSCVDASSKTLLGEDDGKSVVRLAEYFDDRSTSSHQCASLVPLRVHSCSDANAAQAYFRCALVRAISRASISGLSKDSDTTLSSDIIRTAASNPRPSPTSSGLSLRPLSTTRILSRCSAPTRLIECTLVTSTARQHDVQLSANPSTPSRSRNFSPTPCSAATTKDLDFQTWSNPFSPNASQLSPTSQ